MTQRPYFQPEAMWTPVKPRRQSIILEIIGIALGPLALFGFLSFAISQAGTSAIMVATILAFIPLAIVLLTIMWVDRWEREPWSAMLTAFLWGAGVSIAISMWINTAALQALAQRMPFGDAVFWAAVGVAPVVEETAKSLIDLILFLARPRHFDGIVDGIVYAGLSAAGFAFSENIWYFVNSGDYLGQTFVMRALMSPFAHVSFTLAVGVALGIAARKRDSKAWLFYYPAGLIVAMLLHGWWNYSASAINFFAAYVLTQIPYFVILVVTVVFLRRREAAMIGNRAAQYAAAGWLTPAEVQMLASQRERARAVRWAASIGRGDLMKEMQTTATRLAYNLERMTRGRVTKNDSIDQDALLAHLSQQRQRLYAGLR